MNAYNGGRVAHELAAELRYMHQTIFLDTHIHEAAEVGDVGHDAGESHAFLQIVDGLHVFVELKYLDGLSGVRLLSTRRSILLSFP